MRALSGLSSNPRLRGSHPDGRAPPPSATGCERTCRSPAGARRALPSSHRGDGPAAAFLTRAEGGCHQLSITDKGGLAVKTSCPLAQRLPRIP